jgi:hypothetical protein
VKSLRSSASQIALWLTIGVLSVSPRAYAQTLPSEPVVFGNGRVTLGGDVSVTFSCAHSDDPDASACADDAGFFNYTDYEHSALRMVRFDITADIKATDHLSVLGELRSENADSLSPYALYLRIRPWTTRAFAIQAGRVPPVFGAFARRTYPADNLLIGYPLAYQYLTSIRPDALPWNADELLRMRGRGWLSSFSVGNPAPDRGLALVSAFRWDTGVQVHAANEFIEAAGALTTGTLGNPLLGDDNGGKQVAGRVAIHPTPGLIVGLSAARGPFVSRTASRQAGSGGRTSPFTQTGLGTDVEYSRDYYLIRIETVLSDWRPPLVGQPWIALPLRALSTMVEGRYRIRPGLYAAARFDHLGFSEITGSAGPEPWEAPVTRLEVGGGISLQRNLLLKVTFQHNQRDGGRLRNVNLAAAQIVFWL